MRLLICYIIIFCWNSSQVLASSFTQTPVLAFAEFEKLSVTDQAKYIETLQIFAKQLEYSREVSSSNRMDLPPKILSHWNLFVRSELSWASDSSAVCIYAGYISQADGSGACQKPSTWSSRAWNLKKSDGSSSPQKLCTGSGQILCNPLLYGFGNIDSSSGQYSGICTTQIKKPTADCETKYHALPNYPASMVAKQLIANQLAGDFNSMAEQIAAYCSEEGLVKQKSICKTVGDRTAYMKAKLGVKTQAIRPEPISAPPAIVKTFVKPVAKPVVKPIDELTIKPVADVSAKTADAGSKTPLCPTDGSPQEVIQKTAVAIKDIQKEICKPIAGAQPGPGAEAAIKDATYGIWTASSTTQSLFDAGQNAMDGARGASGGCPAGCSRQNDPQIKVATEPTEVVPGSCALFDKSKPLSFTSDDLKSSKGVAYDSSDSALVKTFTGAGSSCKEQMNSWVAATLGASASGCATGDTLCSNIDQVKCPSGCSTANTIKMQTGTPGADSCNFKVRLIIACGPSKKSREWKTKVNLVQNWSCHPADKAK